MGVIKTYEKTALIDAVQWDCTWTSTDQIVAWAAEWGVEIELMQNGDGWKLRIPTLEGPMFASPDDFIAKGINNEFWAIKPDIMGKTYQVVSVGCRCTSRTDWCPNCAKEVR